MADEKKKTKKTGSPHVINATFIRTTKNTHVFQEVGADGKTQIPVKEGGTTFYGRKTVMGEEPPKSVKLTVEW